MKPLLWLSIGSAVVGAVVLLLSKERTGDVPSPPARTYGEPTRVTLPVPSGWRRTTNAEVSTLPELASQANSVMNTQGFTSTPYGTLAPFVASNGKTYATWIEQHYHPPGGAAQPWGLHHGVTVLAQQNQAES